MRREVGPWSNHPPLSDPEFWRAPLVQYGPVCGFMAHSDWLPLQEGRPRILLAWGPLTARLPRPKSHHPSHKNLTFLNLPKLSLSFFPPHSSLL